MIAYVTKYALTRGIYAVEIVSNAKCYEDEAIPTRNEHGDIEWRYDVGDWCEGYVDAVDAANRMRDAMLTTLLRQATRMEELAALSQPTGRNPELIRKRIAKLEALTFPSEAPELKGVGK